MDKAGRQAREPIDMDVTELLANQMLEFPDERGLERVSRRGLRPKSLATSVSGKCTKYSGASISSTLQSWYLFRHVP